jgi:hypothetical protein
MGNRATVIFSDEKGDNFSPAVYLHWNGGPESVYGFLEELDRRKVRADQDYECARFIQLVGEFFDQDTISGYSLGVVNGPKSLSELESVQTDHGDNGFYIVIRGTKNGTIMRRFIERGEGMREMSKSFVKTERQEADKHAYRIKFRETFKKITNGRDISK